MTGGGNQWENPVEFRYEDLNGIKPQMIEEATFNARETALKFAKDSKSRLGKDKDCKPGYIFHRRPRQQHSLYKEGTCGYLCHLLS